jgi:hypothetical protein
LGQRIPQLAKVAGDWNAFNYFGCIATIVGLKRFPPLERLNWLGGYRRLTIEGTIAKSGITDVH